MKKSHIIIGIVVLALIGAGVFWFSPGVSIQNSLFLIPHSAPPSAETELEPYVVPALGETYTNNEYGFSLTLPEGFSARTMSANALGSKTVVLEDGKGNGIQITVTPFDEDVRALTQERIERDVPDMEIKDPQTVEIGANHTGLAFVSDNPAFNGASREVWFVFRKQLYQVSTYLRLDELLQTMFQTWKFE